MNSNYMTKLPSKTQIALTFGGSDAPLSATMTSIDLVAFINSEREKDAKQAGVAFPSKGFAKLQHKDFLAKVPEVLGVETSAKFSADLPDSYGRLQPAYIFPKREACLMSMSYSYELQAKVFDKMTALEQQVAAAPAFQIPTTLSGALMLAAKQAEQIEQQQAQLAIAAPKAQALDRIAQADGDMCIRDAAKHIGTQPSKLTAWMEQNKWIYRRAGVSKPIAYQDRIQSGCLTHKVTTVPGRDGADKNVSQIIVTAKGLAKLAEVVA